MTSKHIESIDVDVPVRLAYDQWTQFEEFPRFMQSVDEIHQVTDDTVHWKVDIAGVAREFHTLITEQTLNECIAWETIDGPDHAGVVTFQPLSDARTRVTLQMEYDPVGFFEHVGDKVGLVSSRLRGDMEAFKTYIEHRGRPSGGWRGSIEQH